MTLFKQFVIENKGKSITFRHNLFVLTKVIADVEEEYFTVKTHEKDPKISGFYYFNECEFYRHIETQNYEELKKVLRTYKDVLIVTHTEATIPMSVYNLGIYIDGEYPITKNKTCGISLQSIKKVFVIENKKWKCVYGEEQEFKPSF